MLKRRKYGAIYACGPGPMLKAAAGLSGRYEIPCQVSLEERMGCAIGACSSVPAPQGERRHGIQTRLQGRAVI
jgi:dihydroorotate dehydrogenase electron transfer subunit